MQLRDPRLWLVHDPEDAPASTRALHALADLGRGVAVVRVTPGLQALQPIAADLLEALGKDHSLPGTSAAARRTGAERRCGCPASACVS